MIYPGVGLIVVGLLVALLLGPLAGAPLGHVLVVLGWVAVVVGFCVLLWHLFATHRHRGDHASGGRL